PVSVGSPLGPPDRREARTTRWSRPAGPETAASFAPQAEGDLLEPVGTQGRRRVVGVQPRHLPVDRGLLGGPLGGHRRLAERRKVDLLGRDLDLALRGPPDRLAELVQRALPARRRRGLHVRCPLARLRRRLLLASGSGLELLPLLDPLGQPALP